MMRSILACLFLLVGSCLVVFGDAAQVVIPKIADAPKIDDFLAMQPSAELEPKLAKIEGFIQSNPRNGAPASQKTVVYLAYDDASLYVIFVCFDTDPGRIAASMTRRENFSDDEDWVEIFLDTYDDQRNAYDFSTNALGVQWDSRYSEATSHQPAFDALWYSDGSLTDRGYVVWMNMPFKSMRFTPEAKQTWRTVFGRSIARNNEYCAWPHISREIQGTLNQGSELTGLEHISPGKNIQFIPYASFRSFRLLDTGANPPGFVTDKSDPSTGLDAKFVLKDSFAFDFALNPDFSQVESDQPQVTVNQRFEVFFPEKRPFFLENTQYFATPVNLVFTRRIADPQIGGRLTGKYGPYTLGFLFTNDEAPGKLVPEDDPLSGRDAYFGIARVSRDVFSQSSVGMLFTNRSFEGSTNSVVGGDFRFRLNDKWQATGQAVRSWTNPLEGESRAGTAYQADVTRSGRLFNYEFIYRDLSPEFQTFTGFVPRTDFRSVENSASYTFRPEGHALVAWGPGLNELHSWDYNGTRLDTTIEPSFHVELQRRTYLNFQYLIGRERIRSSDFPGLTQDLDFETPLWNINASTSYWKWGTLIFEYGGGKAINFVPPTGGFPSSADIMSASATMILRPARRLQLQNNYFFTALKDPEGPTIFNDHIVRARANYQFTRELSFRLILQFEATITNPSLTSLEDRRNLNADVLITYLVNPWTALYVGYNGNRQNLILTENEDGVQIDRTKSSLINDANQFFLKFSYLLRF